MRFTFAFILALALALAVISPAQAETSNGFNNGMFSEGVPAPSHDQLQHDFTMVNRMFGHTTSDQTVADLDGEWLPLSLLANLNGADPEPGLVASYIASYCGNERARNAMISATGPTSFELAETYLSGEMVYRFDWIGGTQFHRSFDPAVLFSTRQLDTMEGERGVELRARTLAGVASTVNVHRVSSDLLVLSTPQRADIYGRCPR